MRISGRFFCVAIAFLTSGMSGFGQTVVQQPVFQSFSTDTTVTVPDGGQALLGGIDSARYGSTSRGTPILGKLPGVGRLFSNRASGSEFNSSRNYVRTRIIDLNEWDQAILNSVPLGTSAGQLRSSNSVRPDVRQNAAQAEARFLSRNVGRRATGGVDQQRRAHEVAPKSNARELLALGDKAIADGKLELAAKYFRAAEQAATTRQ